MKKSVVILIALIYVASIALVGYLGLKARTYNDVIYVETLEILHEYKTDSNGAKHIVFIPNDEDDKSFQLNCRVLPENASNQKVIYALENDCTEAVIDENGLLTFTVDGSKQVYSVTVYLYAHQNTDISDKLTVHYLP